METHKTLFNTVLVDLRMVLHCHGCGKHIPFGSRRTEFCSQACVHRGCALESAFGVCRWCSDLTYQPFKHTVRPHVANEVRMMRALNTFLFEHDLLPFKEQYWFRTWESVLFHQSPADFIKKWYWTYTFGSQPRNGTLPADSWAFHRYMPVERRAENAEWPFYESCFS